MLRWTEAISSTNTAPASLPASSHSLTDFLLWVFVRLWVSFCAWKCVYLWIHVIIHTVAVPFLFLPISRLRFCAQIWQIPESLHCTTLIHAWWALIAFHVKYGKRSLSIGFTFNDCTNSESVWTRGTCSCASFISWGWTLWSLHCWSIWS